MRALLSGALRKPRVRAAQTPPPPPKRTVHRLENGEWSLPPALALDMTPLLGEAGLTLLRAGPAMRSPIRGPASSCSRSRRPAIAEGQEDGDQGHS